MTDSEKKPKANSDSKPTTLEPLLKLSEAIQKAHNSEEVLKSAYQILCRQFTVDALSFGWTKDDQQRIEWIFLMEKGQRCSNDRENITNGIIRKAISNREVLIVDNVSSKHHNVPIGAEQHHDRSRSMMIAPVYEGQNIPAVLTVKSYGDCCYGEQDASFLAVVCAIIGSRILNLQLLSDTEQLQQQLDGLFHHLNTGIALVDNNFHLIYSNHWLTQNLDGCQNGGNCYTSFFGLQQPCTGCYLKELDDAAIPDRIVEVTCGQKVYAIQLIPIRLRDGEFIFLEIIEDRSLQSRLQSQLTEIKRLNSIISFARSIGHELNQPLTGITGYCALIKEDVNEDGSIYHDIAEIEKQAIRLERIVNKFQSITHLDYKE